MSRERPSRASRPRRALRAFLSPSEKGVLYPTHDKTSIRSCEPREAKYLLERKSDMKFHEAIVALKKVRTTNSPARERARTTPCIYTMIQNEEKEIKVYRTMILPGGKKEAAEHIDYQELLTVDSSPSISNPTTGPPLLMSARMRTSTSIS